jgi:hypothetical protein
MFTERLHRALAASALLFTACNGCANPSQPDATATMDVVAVVDASGDIANRRDAAAPDASLVIEAGCYPYPSGSQFPLDDASCGEGCARVWHEGYARERGVYRERDGEFEMPTRDTFTYYRPGTATQSLIANDWRRPMPGFCPPGSQGSVSGFGVDGAGLLFGCLVADDLWQMLRANEDRTAICPLFPVSLGTALGFAPSYLTHVRGAYAFVRGYRSQGPGDLTIVDEGSSTPRRVANCDCVLEAGGADDTIFYIKDSATRQFAELWILRYPYRDPQLVWAPDMTMQSIAQDPTDPHRFVFVGHRSGPNCQQGGDIYLFDTRTVDREPPRNLTNSATTQVWPVVRGDWVAFLDYARDPVSPNGCIEDRHEAWGRTLVQISTGRRLPLVDNIPNTSAPFALFSTHALVGTGYIVPLPPEARQ